MLFILYILKMGEMLGRGVVVGVFLKGVRKSVITC